MLHHFFPKKNLILKKIQLSTTLNLQAQVQKVHHLRDIRQYINGYFKSQQKDNFCQGNLHQDK